jgi:hypothetical protein
MTDRLTLRPARQLLRLLKGETVSDSSLRPFPTDELLSDGIFTSLSRGSYKYIKLASADGLMAFLSQRYGVNMPLAEWIILKETPGDRVSRAEQVVRAGESKLKRVRSFRGFLFNCTEPVDVVLCGKPTTLHPLSGTSFFIEDYQSFHLPPETLVVGIENGENFQHLASQRYLFPQQSVVFVSRYPQSHDLREWLQHIPNRYLHFGDFDLAGISIYLSEFYASLGHRAEFFIPPDIEERLRDYGNPKLYEKQYLHYRQMEITDERVRPLVRMIHHYKRGYEQEGYLHPS